MVKKMQGNLIKIEILAPEGVLLPRYGQFLLGQVVELPENVANELAQRNPLKYKLVQEKSTYTRSYTPPPAQQAIETEEDEN